MTLRDVAPREIIQCVEPDELVFSLLDEPVVATHDVRDRPFPGTHKFVMVWWELNGYAVGWNENPSRGWSFPVVRLPR